VPSLTTTGDALRVFRWAREHWSRNTVKNNKLMAQISKNKTLMTLLFHARVRA
jgi:hypothetical protein